MKRTPLPVKRRTKEEVAEARKKKNARLRERRKAGDIPRSDLLKQADDLARDYCRSKGYCEMEGAGGKPCGGWLEWCHLKSRDFKYIRHDPLNCVCMCKSHHAYFTLHPDLWVRAMEEFRPGVWDRLNALLIEQKEKMLKPDYEYWIDFYTRQKEQC